MNWRFSRTWWVRDYWVFSTEENKPNYQRFLVSKDNSLFRGKNLNQNGSLITLSYSENEVVKKVEKTYSDGKPMLTILESGFSLAPDLPWKNDPDFRTNWEKGHDIMEKVKFVGKGDDGNGTKVLLFNNYFADENGQLPTTLKVFHITEDSLLSRQLLRENKLQKGKKFILGFNKVTKKKLNYWCFDSTCDRKIWIDEID